MRTVVAVLGTVMALFSADLVREQKLQKAIDLMESKGDAAGAMALLNDATQSKDRGVAARALLYLGQFQERQGKDKARQTYERIAREFGEQREVVAQARQRLVLLSNGAVKASNFLTSRQIWTGADVDSEGAPSPDGRFFSFVHWASGDLAVRDMATGEIRRLGLKQSWTESIDFGEWPVFSPDQRQIAYAWYSSEKFNYELRIAGAEPGSKPRVLISDNEVSYFLPTSWSLDGKRILTMIARRNGRHQIAWVSAADGETKVIKVLEWRHTPVLSLSADGRFIAYDGPEDGSAVTHDIYILAADGSSESVAVRHPGMDSAPIWSPDGRNLIFNSNRSGSTGLWSIAVENGKSSGPPKLLKPDMGSISPRGFVRSGTMYYIQSTGDQNVYTADVDPDTAKAKAPVAVASSYLGKNRWGTVSPDGKHVAFLSARGFGPGALTMVVRSLENGAEKAFTTGLQLVSRPLWLPDSLGILQVARDTRGIGSVHRLDMSSGQTVLLHTLKLTQSNHLSVSPNGRFLYFSTFDRENKRALIDAWDITTGQQRTIYTPTEKIFINAVAVSPDDRSLAVTMNTTLDQKPTSRLLLMDIDGKNVRTLFENQLPGDLKPWAGVAWSADGGHVFFVRATKEDPERSQIWRLAVNGGEPQPTGIQGPGVVSQINVSATGRLAYTAGRALISELWALDNLLPALNSTR